MKRSSINILIADDDFDDASMLSEALQEHLPSCKCTHTTDGMAALRIIKTEREPDLVFLDINMPIKDGIHCLRDIHNNNLLPNTPIFIFSTSKNMKDIKAADEYGAAFYIVKPSSVDELNRIIKRAINLLGKPKPKRSNKSDFVIRESYIN
jgi:CheY-like chemotaxis protein